MASVITDSNGTRRIQWCVGKAGRRTLRLGRVSSKQAEAVKVRVEQVLASRSTGVLDHQAESWLAGLDDGMHEKLARLDLVKPRTSTVKTLAELLTEYFANLSVKPGTKRTYAQTQDSLIEHFGSGQRIAQITPLECDRWVSSMRKAELAEATVSKRIKTAKQFFKAAMRWKLISENPFAEIRAGGVTNRARMRFISQADIAKVLDACPDAQWRLIVLLSRYGGLRCPSEVLALKWTDIDFANHRITVRSCKTEHYAGKDQRQVPLFVELQRPLITALHEATEGSEYVVEKHRLLGGNPRTQMHRIINRAGLEPWPKPFHNLRSSRQTELAERHPIHVVCAWLGNSPTIAIGHYLQVTDEHFRRAVDAGTGSSEALPQPSDEAAAQAPRAAPSGSGGTSAPRRADDANVAA